jgi:chorismate mutase/prephenate dehydratase
MNTEGLKKKIAVIDRKILELLKKRCSYSESIGKLSSSEKKTHLYIPDEERHILSNLEKTRETPLTISTIRAVFREIISGASQLESPVSVAFLGPEATFSHLAAMAIFGRSVNFKPESNISDVFKDVESGRTRFGCVPIENSTEGAVNHTLDMFVDSSVSIRDELNLRIHHNLMALDPEKQITRVYSHAQVLGQCRNWLLANLPGAELVETASTTKAARHAGTEKGAAAIASSLAAEIHKLNIISANIEDNSNNTTRFLVLSNEKAPASGNDKTSICFAIRDRVGALYDCLLPFKKEKLTLTMIESRPSKRREWEYFFFMDFLGHREDEKVKKALDRLGDLALSMRILGSYPRSTEAV